MGGSASPETVPPIGPFAVRYLPRKRSKGPPVNSQRSRRCRARTRWRTPKHAPCGSCESRSTRYRSLRRRPIRSSLSTLAPPVGVWSRRGLGRGGLVTKEGTVRVRRIGSMSYRAFARQAHETADKSAFPEEDERSAATAASVRRVEVGSDRIIGWSAAVKGVRLLPAPQTGPRGHIWWYLFMEHRFALT